MSSSSSPGSSKRKRGPSALHDLRNSSTADLQQPSSRDASGEELAEDEPVSKHRKGNGKDKSEPLVKRARTRSASHKAATVPTSSNSNGDVQNLDPGEKSDTTVDSIEIAKNSQVRGDGPAGPNYVAPIAKNGEQTLMAGPGKGGLTHPRGGYTTNPPPEGRPVRVYADGVFDLFHLGHMRQLEQAKKAFPNVYLIVGVTGDEETHRRKGLTVLSGKERAETVRHCKWVDEVLPNCPWIVTAEFLLEHKIDYVAHDDEPYGADEGDDIYKPIKERGMFLVTQRTEGVSTTGIITKIVRDYEKYIARQFKRGTSRQELNVSWLKKNELDLKRHVNEIRDSIKSNWTTTGNELGREIKSFWFPGSNGSRPASPARGRLGKSASEVDLSQGAISPKSASALAKLGHLDIPQSKNGQHDFLSGYTLGLVGGVRSWMTRKKVTRDDGDSVYKSEEDSEGPKSPVSDYAASVKATEE